MFRLSVVTITLAFGVSLCSGAPPDLASLRDGLPHE